MRRTLGSYIAGPASGTAAAPCERMGGNVEPLSAVMPSAVRQLLRHGPMSAGKLGLAWRLAVGLAIDRATEVRMREDGTLDVVAADARWRRELKRSHDVVLTRLRDLLGPDAVTRIRVLGRPGKV
jgi:predicted nucleic acid-binding Zn ribbon protein